MSAGKAGVLFVATGAAHVEAARRAAESVRATNPGLSIAIHCDSAAPGAVFDVCAPIAAPHARSKVDVLAKTPFARTLYLDCDTRVVADLADLFPLLDRFDLALAHVVRWHKRGYQRIWRQDVPAAFPQHNSGVILYRRTPAVIAFLEQWRADYHAAGIKEDQVTLRELLWTTGLRVAVLPPQFNARRHTLVDRYLSQRPPPRILHLPKYNPKKHRG